MLEWFFVCILFVNLQVFTTNEAVKGPTYQRLGREKENYMIMPNSAFSESDQSNDHKVRDRTILFIKFFFG